jgi:hypothetical protein
MQNTCPNPGCGAMYNLTPQHVGRSFVCKKCGATLHVTDDGLELAGTAPAGAPGAESFTPAAEDPTPMRRPTRVGKGAGVFFRDFWGRVRNDVSTWLFGVGAFFAIICLFFPLLDRGKILDREAALSASERRERRLNEELARKIREKGEGEFAKEKENRDKANKHWQEVEKPKLQERIDDARDSAKTWRYWYDWGMMWGFLFLALAALGYLTPQQPTIRRVVGSIIFCAMILLIFIRFVIESAARSAL